MSHTKKAPTWIDSSVAMPPLDGEPMIFMDTAETHSVSVLIKVNDEIYDTEAYFNYSAYAWTLPSLAEFIEPSDKVKIEWISIIEDEKTLEDMYEELNDTHAFMLDRPSKPYHKYEYEVTQVNTNLPVKSLRGVYSFLISYAYQKHLEQK